MVEGVGCFNDHSFSIGLNDDIYLINFIKEYLDTTEIVKISSRNFYSLEIYNKETLKTIQNHFKNYPFLGEKAESFKK